MCEAKERFLKALGKEIGDHPKKEHILQDYELHIIELLHDKPPMSDSEASYRYLVDHIGSPEEIAKLWEKEIKVTPHKTQWLFVICNMLILIGGTLLILSYHLFGWKWLGDLWQLMTDIPFLLTLVYLLFWGLLGYEIGREFGHRGKRLLRRTFFISMIPNVFIMYLMVFKIIPYEWFQPVLKLPFLVICILFTACLYPISYVGYLWGRKLSI